MTRDECKAQVLARLPIALGRAAEVDAILSGSYPRDAYRTEGHPERDYNFSHADVMELERAMRRRLRI